MRIVLVRHAEAGRRSEWAGDDRLRPLSPKGRLQAQSLVGTLGGLSPSLVGSSPALRCVETVAPLAESLGLTVELLSWLSEGSGSRATSSLRSVKVDCLFSTHGDVIEEVLRSLVGTDGLRVPSGLRWEKSSAWVLEKKGDSFLEASYIRPPS